MTSFIMPSTNCKICGKSRRVADHSECSKKLQQLPDKKRKNSAQKYAKNNPVTYWEKDK